jgi:hypothetical protein
MHSVELRQLLQLLWSKLAEVGVDQKPGGFFRGFFALECD